MTSEERLTADEAYLAMFHFLDRYYEATKADEIGVLLGGLAPLPDGGPSDPAFQKEWREAVQAALTETRHTEISKAE